VSLLDVEGLRVQYPGAGGPVVDDVSFSVEAGECVALAGASGSGKTQTALAIMGLLGPHAAQSGRLVLNGEEISNASRSRWQSLRGAQLAMVFQDPNVALNPHLRIGQQLGLILEQHRLASRAQVHGQVIEMLKQVGLPDPERQSHSYPFQLSGGMRQRALIAAALIAKPAIVIADEPTTALDATVQVQILSLLQRLREQTGVAMLLITHNVGVIASSSERLLVMQQGRLIEQAATAIVFERPTERQTQLMLEVARRTDSLVQERAATYDAPLLRAERLSVTYEERAPNRLWAKSALPAVRSADLELAAGETLAIVGESGCGKTSLVRAILGLQPATEGQVSYLGQSLAPQLKDRSNDQLAALQLVFQDPQGSLDPTMRLARSIAEPLLVHRPELASAQRTAEVSEIAARVGLPGELLDRFPHQLSGGQAQRAAIARALILKPKILVCDEAFAALDASVREGILELLAAEQRSSGLAILFVSHDLALVRRFAHRVLVMYMGRTVESATREALFAGPRHPYTRALIDATLATESAAGVLPEPLAGEPASPLHPPAGCSFHPRCAYAVARCRQERPELRQHGYAPAEPVEVACHRAAEIDLSDTSADRQ